MSQWTHINAVIRYDCVAALGMMLPDMDNVPEGSEGPMNLLIVKNPNNSAMASHTAMFWGDLRDYSDRHEIMKYFERITNNYCIRSGLLEIDIEGCEPETFRYNNEEGKGYGYWIQVTKK